MPTDDQDIAVARFVKQTGLATAEQVAEAMQAQARSHQGGNPISRSEALVQKGVLTAAQRETVEKKAQAAGFQQLLHYRLLKKLGEGGMGAVYLAEDTQQARKVAVKVLPRRYAAEVELLKRFRREADAAGKLKHPNIVGAYSFGEDRGFHFYVMEYCEGETLDATLKRDRSLPIPRAIDFVLQAARGLQYAHDQGVIHRDIKPANLMVTRNGTAKILDLGLSKILDESEKSFKTVSGAVLGTPHYISPEQAQGEKEIDGRTDIYSLGATFYHLLTGQTPFDGSTIFEILSKQVNAQLPNPQDLREEIPDGAVHVLRRMMAKAPGDRYRSCADLIDDLTHLLAGKAPATQVLDPALSAVALVRKRPSLKRPATVRRTTAKPGRSGALVGGIVAAAALVVVLFVLIPRNDDSKPVKGATAGAKPPPVSKAAPSDPWEGAIGLLGLIDLEKDRVAGEWKRWKSGFISCESAPVARIIIPYQPPEEYDLRLQFSLRGGTGGVGLIFAAPGQGFLGMVAGYGNAISAFEAIRGAPANSNPTTKKFTVQYGQTYTTVVRVRRDGISALIDGREIAAWKTDYSDMSLHSQWKLPSGAVLGVGSYESLMTIHGLDLLEVKGRGRPARAPSKAVDEAWVAEVVKRPPDERVKAVMAKMKELNPDSDGKYTHVSEGPEVVRLDFISSGVTNLGPLCALRGLTALVAKGRYDGARNAYVRTLSDLEPLRGLPLQRLQLNGTRVQDLGPLQGMRLTSLDLSGTEVRELGPLKESSLEFLGLQDTKVTSLAPLEGMPLKELFCDAVSEADATILRRISTLQRINGVASKEFLRASGGGTSLVGHWKFDEGFGETTANAVPTRPPALLSGPTWAEGKFGKALQFSGREDHAAVENFSFVGKAITVSGWVRHDALGNTIQRYVTLVPEVVVLRYDRIEHKGLHFALWTGRKPQHLTAAVDLKIGAWHHVAGTWDGAIQRLYFDGVEVARADLAGEMPESRMIKISNQGEAMQGRLDDVRVYNRALSSAEIVELAK